MGRYLNQKQFTGRSYAGRVRYIRPLSYAKHTNLRYFIEEPAVAETSREYNSRDVNLTKSFLAMGTKKEKERLLQRARMFARRVSLDRIFMG